MSAEVTTVRPDGLPSDERDTEPETVTRSWARAGRGRSLPAGLRARSPAWVWIGIGVAMLGFILIWIGWAQVAAENQVYLQVPYVVSAALTGLGLVMVGLFVLNFATRQSDSADRDREIAQLVATLEELRETLAGEEEGG